MPSVTLSFSDAALQDLFEIRAWYSEQGVPDVGARFVAEIFQQVQLLTSHPEMGRVVQEFGQPFLREIILPPFRIVYRCDPARVRVVRVWRSERLLRPSEVDDE
ncbi:MAG: type II toxin-antitoxin system RelE/ParE family toxin [Gammaproteobacteria bacterium]